MCAEQILLNRKLWVMVTVGNDLLPTGGIPDFFRVCIFQNFQKIAKQNSSNVFGFTHTLQRENKF
jgi:hypothetical protein